MDDPLHVSRPFLQRCFLSTWIPVKVERSGTDSPKYGPSLAPRTLFSNSGSSFGMKTIDRPLVIPRRTNNAIV